MNFIESANRFTQYFKENANLKNFVERLLLQDSQDKEELEDDPDVRKNEVTLMTLHSSKGLEFKKVYLVGMEEETLPHKKPSPWEKTSVKKDVYAMLELPERKKL